MAHTPIYPAQEILLLTFDVATFMYARLYFEACTCEVTQASKVLEKMRHKGSTDIESDASLFHYIGIESSTSTYILE